MLGRPETAYHSILVAGTKGKGSTANYLSGALRAAGYRVGLYTQPHLTSFRERMQIDGALLPADRVISTQHGWLSPLPPEGASAIMYRTTDRASEIAHSQGVRSLDLLRNGIVDRVIAEGTDARQAPEELMRKLGRVLEQEITALLLTDPEKRLAQRLERYNRLGIW